MTLPAARQKCYHSSPRYGVRGVVMTGGIYTREKCSICGKVMRYNGKGCSCPDHPTERRRRAKGGIVPLRKAES